MSIVSAIEHSTGSDRSGAERHPRIVIAGGGVAALETLLALRALAGASVRVTLVSPSHDFHYRPMTVTEPFELGEARSFPLTAVVGSHGGGEIVWGALAEVDPERRVVITGTGDEVEYDALVIATGAIQQEALPGSLMFRGDADVERLRGLLDELSRGEASSVAFVVPVPGVWSLPLYELALMSAGHVREHCGDDTRVILVTPEEEPLELFGPDASRAIAELLDGRGIELVGSSLPASIDGRALLLAGGGRVYADRFVSTPVLRGPALRGLPHDADGFIPIDAYGRVPGLEDVYAAGDVCSFPLKQGGIATQQADAVAETIAAGAGAPIVPSPFTPVLRGLLLTGGAPLYLRCEPQRLHRSATVAIEADRRSDDHPTGFGASGQALWWPPSKIAGRYLAPYLATARPEPLSSHLLADRGTAMSPPPSAERVRGASELALLIADCDARWGDYASAVGSVDSAEALAGSIPAEYEAKRRQWRAAGHVPVDNP